MQFPYAALPVGPDGTADPAQLQAVVAATLEAAPSDVLVISHGWQEDAAAATALYTRITDQIAGLLAADPRPERSFAVVGILWPAISWVDDSLRSHFGFGLADPHAQLVQSIRTGVADPQAAAALEAQSADLHTAAGRAAFVATLRAQLPAQAAVADDDALPWMLATGDAERLFRAVREVQTMLSAAIEPAAARAGDLAAAPAAAPRFGLNLGPFSPEAIAKRLINLAGYYTMKDRAGKVGAGAVAALLEELHKAGGPAAAGAQPGLRLHLCGHSFGARVAASAAATTTSPIHSISLLQGAFSDLGFAAQVAGGQGPGAFRGVLTSGVLRGPVIATCTHHDLAVTIAYAIASRLAHQVSSLIGGANDSYAGIGANGAVATAEASSLTMAPAGGQYAFVPQRIHNLHADAYISGHMDVTGPEVANAILQAMTTAA